MNYNDYLRKKKREEAHSTFRRILPKYENASHDKKVAKDLIRAILNERCPASQLVAAKKIREYSIDNRLMIETAIKVGLLAAIKDKLLLSKSLDLQIEGVWICANISLEHAEEILKNKAHIPLFNLMLKERLTEGCLWTITNICNDSKDTRDELLSHGVLFYVTNLCYKPVPMKIHQQISSVLLNFAKFSSLSKELVNQLLGLVKKYLKSDDFESCYNSLCAITFLAADEENIQPIMFAGIIPVLISILNSKNTSCEEMAANLLKRLASTIDENCLIDILSVMPNALKNQRARTTSDILQFIATIAECENFKLWKKIVENDELLIKVIKYVNDGNLRIVESALELLFELAERAEYEDNKRLVNKGLVEALCQIIGPDQKLDILKISLEVLGRMLEKSEGEFEFK